MKRHLLRVPARRWKRWLSNVRWSFRGRGGRAGRSSSPAVTADAAMSRPATVDHIVDPDGRMRLVRITGCATHRTIDDVDAITGALPPRSGVHLDLVDARIASVSVMRDLERLADRLEQAGMQIKVVGVDPNHPALQRRS